MGKKQQIQILTGSTIRSPFRYLTKVELSFYPLHLSGFKDGRKLYRMIENTPKALLQPGFEMNIDKVFQKENPGLYFKWMNGWEKGYDLTKESFSSIYTDLEHYNYHIELDRSVQGYDDDFDDEFEMPKK
mmetsp:Transcript_59737/g.67948  ORF Transcript_59737/g.67948 Transcript_59737/m.67948 type:complete len:130 (+) Transcript_59737:68-457(+)